MPQTTPEPPAEDWRVSVMGALSLLMDIAFDEVEDLRLMAVIEEAACQAGFAPGVFVPSRKGLHYDEAQARVLDARKGRHGRLLRANARGMLSTLRMLAEAGVLTYGNTAEAEYQRWLARGGHNQ